MNRQFFRAWNWEFDYGVDAVDNSAQLPQSYAAAYFDDRGRLYRVDVWQDSPEADSASVIRYDYFCDNDGRILQKRSLGDENEVFLIVDFDYDNERNLVIETAWWPKDGIRKSVERQLNQEHSRRP